MRLVYSALNIKKRYPESRPTEAENDIEKLRLQAYLSVCNKYQHEIKAIQQCMPGWKPAFIVNR